jgi:hypothetical protein
MLDNVVSVLVLDQLLDVRVQFVENWQCLLSGAVFKDALDNPAAVGVCGQREHLQTANLILRTNHHLNRHKLRSYYVISSVLRMKYHQR